MTLLRLLLAFGIGLGWAARGAAADPGARFRGLQFGVDVRQQLPRCPDNGQSSTRCWQAPPACGGKDCDVAWSVVFHDSLSDIFFRPRVEQVDGKLAAVSSSFHVGDFLHLVALFQAKYGHPAVSAEEPWESAKSGVHATMQKRVWNWKGLQIELRAPADDLRTGKLFVANAAYMELKKNEEATTFKQQLDDL